MAVDVVLERFLDHPEAREAGGLRVRARMVADTGAEVTAIAAPLVRKLGVDPDSLPLRPLTTALGAENRPFISGIFLWFGSARPQPVYLPTAAVLTKPLARAAPLREPNFPLPAARSPSISILGTDALRALGATVVADFKKGRGYLEW